VANAALFTRSEMDLQGIVECFVEVCRHRGMGANVNKSKVMVVERE